jgi:dihydroneopterin aldolase
MAAERDNEDPDELTGADTPDRDGHDEPAESTESALGEAADADAVGDGDELDYMDLPEASGEVSSYALEGEDDDEDLDVEREETGESVTIEIAGLSLYTPHGVSEAEREIGQRLVFDLRLDLGETDATVTDSIEDTVDYGEVCQLVALIAQQRSHKTLERLCSTIADRLLGDYELEGVWVKATKPEPPIALPVDEVSVEVWREAEE